MGEGGSGCGGGVNVCARGVCVRVCVRGVCVCECVWGEGSIV